MFCCTKREKKEIKRGAEKIPGWAAEFGIQREKKAKQNTHLAFNFWPSLTPNLSERSRIILFGIGGTVAAFWRPFRFWIRAGHRQDLPYLWLRVQAKPQKDTPVEPQPMSPDTPPLLPAARNKNERINIALCDEGLKSGDNMGGGNGAWHGLRPQQSQGSIATSFACVL